MKKIIVICLALLSVLTFTSCAQENKKENPSEETSDIKEITLTDGAGYLLEGDTLYFKMAVETDEIYLCNMTSTFDWDLEYSWAINFTDGTNEYEIGTSWFKNVSEKYPENCKLEIEDMQSGLYLRTKNEETGRYGSKKITSAEVIRNEDTLTWKVVVPAEYKLQNNNLEILSQETPYYKSVKQLTRETDEYITAQNYQAAYDNLLENCNEANYEKAINLINEVLPYLFEPKISYQILERKRISFTMEVTSQTQDILVNDSKKGCYPGMAGYERTITFFSSGEQGGTYALTSFYLCDVDKDGWDVVMQMSDLTNVFVKQENDTLDQNPPFWHVIENADVSVDGQNITWSFTLPEEFDPYRFIIKSVDDKMAADYYID